MDICFWVRYRVAAGHHNRYTKAVKRGKLDTLYKAYVERQWRALEAMNLKQLTWGRKSLS